MNIQKEAEEGDIRAKYLASLGPEVSRISVLSSFSGVNLIKTLEILNKLGKVKN